MVPRPCLRCKSPILFGRSCSPCPRHDSTDPLHSDGEEVAVLSDVSSLLSAEFFGTMGRSVNPMPQVTLPSASSLTKHLLFRMKTATAPVTQSTIAVTISVATISFPFKVVRASCYSSVHVRLTASSRQPRSRCSTLGTVLQTKRRTRG